MREREPALPAFVRQHGSIARPVPYAPPPDAHEFVMICTGLFKATFWILWWGLDEDNARLTFRKWLSGPWAAMDRDFDHEALTYASQWDFRPADHIRSFWCVPYAAIKRSTGA